jgi:tRNA-dihydrouridine synthase
MLKTSREDKPIGIQITGRNVEEFRKVVPHLRNYDLVDINCGCPSSRIVGNDSGSYLLNKPKKIGEMIRVLKDEGLIVSAKIRLGFKKNNALKIAREVEKAGADLLTVHARLASQSSSVPADWKWIEKIRSKIGIPVVGNGDVNSGERAKEMLEIADGVMVARAAIGNPLIFNQIQHYLKTGKEKEFGYKDNLKLFRNYLTFAERHKVVEIPRIKFLAGNFLRKFEGAAKAREGFSRIKDIQEAKGFLANL